jgi:hypothetical protein
MACRRSTLFRLCSRFAANQTPYLNVPLYHILILAWCAIVVLYGETGRLPLSLHNAV